MARSSLKMKLFGKKVVTTQFAAYNGRDFERTRENPREFRRMPHGKGYSTAATSISFGVTAEKNVVTIHRCEDFGSALHCHRDPH
jgi:hypothetical protein